jgi:hypothetical protein
MKKALILIPMMMTLASCEQSFDNTTNDDSVIRHQKVINTKRLAVEDNSAYAAKLTRVGEILVNNPVGFSHAHDLFNEALAIDPTNNKALFYSAMTEMVMTFRGAAEKSRDLMDKPEDLDTYIKYMKENVKYPEFVDFIIGDKNAKKFQNYQDIKRFFQKDFVAAIDKAVTKMEKIDGDVNIILTQLAAEKEDIEYDCETYGEGETSFTECQIKEEMKSIEALPAETKTVDQNDIKVIASGLRAYGTYFKMLTAYSIEGGNHLSNEVRVKEMDLGRSLTDQETHRIVKRYPKVLTLEADHQLGDIVGDLESIAYAAMDLEALNNRFCDTDLRTNNLVDNICFDADSRESIEKALDYLTGPVETVLGKDKLGNDVTILVDLPGYLSNPVQDLKVLLPTEYDENGHGKLTQEPELNGLFPNKDLMDKLAQVVSQEVSGEGEETDHVENVE